MLQCKRYLGNGTNRCTNEAAHNILVGEDCFDFELYCCEGCATEIGTNQELRQKLIPYTVVKLEQIGG